LFDLGQTSVKMSNFLSEYPTSIGIVKYKTNYASGTATIPNSFVLENYLVYCELNNNQTLSISKTISNTDIGGDGDGDGDGDIPVLRTNVAIHVKDFATDVNISGAFITIDNSPKGSTNEDGVYVIPSIYSGDHTIKITASGYLDSDEDELANDTFTVS
jgi:hypothetical protein